MTTKTAILNATLALVFSAFLLAGCNSKVMKASSSPTGSGGPTKVAPTGPPIYFAEVRARILDKYCTRCHEEFVNYQDVLKPEVVIAGDVLSSPLFNRLQNSGGDMPSRAAMIPDADAALIRDWIAQGAPLDDASAAKPAPAPAPIATPMPLPIPVPAPEMSFANIEAKIFAPKCVMCHSDARMAAGFSLEKYDGFISNPRLVDLKNPEKSGLYQSVVDDFMPLRKAVAAGRVKILTPLEKALLKSWLQAGASR